jgi:hypothetical protein
MWREVGGGRSVVAVRMGVAPKANPPERIVLGTTILIRSHSDAKNSGYSSICAH